MTDVMCVFFVVSILLYLGWRVSVVGKLIDRVDVHLDKQDREADDRLHNQVIILEKVDKIVEHCNRCDAHFTK